jgi:type II secretion system protein N
MKKFLIAIIALAAAFIWGFWLVAVPTDLIVSSIEESLDMDSLNVEVVGFKKGLFYNFTIEGVDFKKSGTRLLSVDDISGRVDLLSLLSMKAVIPFRGNIGGGELKGIATLKRKDYEVNLSINNARISELGLFEYTGIRGDGILKAELNMKNNSGVVKFSVNNLQLEDTPFSGVRIPLAMFHTARGAATFKRTLIKVKSFSIEGKGLYARLKGTIQGRTINVKLELMPEEPEPLIFALLKKYQVSSRYYVIPIKRVLRF